MLNWGDAKNACIIDRSVFFAVRRRKNAALFKKFALGVNRPLERSLLLEDQITIISENPHTKSSHGLDKSENFHHMNCHLCID